MAIKLEDGPMSEMNTTPLIDVMLVLLIMFIITIPIATHSVDIDLPYHDCIDCPVPESLKNKIVIDTDDTLRWNGESISEAQLGTLLSQTRLFDVEPELQYEPSANASYQKSARILQIIKASGVTKFGFVGNERYRRFGRGD